MGTRLLTGSGALAQAEGHYESEYHWTELHYVSEHITLRCADLTGK
jgi:hypothetical protein